VWAMNTVRLRRKVPSTFLSPKRSRVAVSVSEREP
jgi:hypothetical protein